MLTFLTRPHFWMVLPSTAWISSRSMFSHMVGPSAWNDRSQKVKKSSLLLTHLTAATWSSLHGFSTVTVDSATWSPAQQHEAATLSLKTKLRPREAKKPNLILKKNLPMKQTRACLSVAKSAKIHSRHRSGCSTLLRVPFRKWLVYISLFISKYSQKIKLHS